jgi:DNA-binding SARP family transcriptional activator/Tfp pilus assembly protein PilF
MLNLQRSEYESACALAEPFLDEVSEFANLRGRALNIMGVANLHTGDLRAAARYLEDALPLYRDDGDAYATSQVLQSLEVVYTRLGRLNEAATCLQEVVALRRSLGSAGALALALNNLGYYYHQQSDYQQALATFQEGLSVVAKVPNRRAESYLLWSLGDLQRDQNAFNEARQLYNRALELLGSSEPSLKCSVLISFSTLQRWQGNLHEAALMAAEAAAVANAHKIALEGASAQAALWCARAIMGQAPEALPKLESIASSLGEQGPQPELVKVLVLCAHTALLCSDKMMAESHLRTALRTARDLNSAQALAAEILHTPLLEAIINADSSSRYEVLARELKCLREAQRKATIEAPVTSSTSNRLAQETYSIKVFALGREVIERDGVRIPLSEWRATAARELFLYLLFMGPETRERICLAFWPDSSAKKVRSNFHTTLWRARQALGENVITFEDEIYQINPDIDVWCDARELESLTRQARLFSSRDARTEDLWQKAIALYRGGFLPSLDAEWVISQRDLLHEAHVEALIGLGECARARNSYREAIHAFKRALDLEPYREDIHRAIMTCYANLGEKKQIHAHLHRLQELFRHDLAAEPSRETIVLARTLLG